MKKILSVGHMQFPLGQAQVQRQLLMAKAINLAGFDVTVLCRYGIHSLTDGIANEGFFEGVHYFYCSGTSIRPESIIKRNLLKFRGLFKEFNFYQKFSKESQLAGVIVSTNRFHNILFYFLLGKIFKVTSVVDNVEYWTSNKNIKGWLRVDKYLYDKFYFLFSDRIICISDFLASKVWETRRDKVIKIPVITDFDKFNGLNTVRLIKEKYFLFCGSKAYFEIIDFVISSFEILDRNEVFLVLVTEQTDALNQRTGRSTKGNSIKVLTNIPYDDLLNLYVNSEALIIPMRNSDQDKARFPHKIGEYCAACRPIITNRVGEIENFFTETNSYLCNDYNKFEYAMAMRRIITEPDQATKIAENSYKTGLLHFNYKSYSKAIADLFFQG